MEFERARLDREGAVAILSMNHPEVLNAVSPEMLKGLTDALDVLADSSERTRCLVITPPRGGESCIMSAFLG